MNKKVVGIHLSGSNAKKTALVVFEVTTQGMELMKIFDRIGSYGSVFSDDRVVDIVTQLGSTTPVCEVFVDCPTTLPPCVECTRPVCPGALKCEDTSVAMMLSLAAQDARKGAKKLRPLNPQSHRLWDVFFGKQILEENIEPTYSANLAPLVTRARTLQRRFNACLPDIKLKETNVPHVLMILTRMNLISEFSARNYRRFENGAKAREEAVESLLEKKFFRFRGKDSVLESLIESNELFCSFVTGMVGGLHVMGLTIPPPANMRSEDGWVFLPAGMNGVMKEV